MKKGMFTSDTSVQSPTSALDAAIQTLNDTESAYSSVALQPPRGKLSEVRRSLPAISQFSLLKAKRSMERTPLNGRSLAELLAQTGVRHRSPDSLTIDPSKERSVKSLIDGKLHKFKVLPTLPKVKVFKSPPKVPTAP